MSTIDHIRLSYPLPVAKLYEVMCLEKEPRERVRKLIDLFDGIVRYLVLVGLASYIYHELSDPEVEEARLELERPSLGSWVKLLRLIDVALRANNITALLGDPDQFHKDDFIFRASQVLAQVAERDQPKKVRLTHFFDSVVQFRNKKIGHGSLSTREAKQALEPLELGISQWLSELSVLHQQHLVYIDRIEWQNPNFICYGTNLNSGVSLFPFELTRDKPTTHGQVYLHLPASGFLVALYPFFVFDNDVRLLFMYDELSSKRELVVRCPYESPKTEGTRYLNYDESIIVGVMPPTNYPGTTGHGATKNVPRVTVNKYIDTLNRIKASLTETWLTDSQQAVWIQLNKLMGPPYYVVNIYGASGTGKTFLGWLLQKQGKAVYVEAKDISWQSLRGQPLVVLDGYDPSRRAVRSLQPQLQLWNIDQVIILTRQKAQDDIPCLHIAVTDKDIQVVKATLYRELNIVVPEGNYQNLSDCFKHLEEQP